MTNEPKNEQRSDSPDDSPRTRKVRGGRASRLSKWQRSHSGDLFLIFIVFLFVILIFGFDAEKVADLLYNKTAGFILVIMVIEYLVLKSMDRTRIYGLENSRLREARRTDRALMKRARELLDEAAGTSSDDDEESPSDWNKRARDVAEELSQRL